jgi:hypothetical protein
MGLPENPTGLSENQGPRRRKRKSRRPRTRRCLLKGCEQRYHPRQAQERYCSEGCRKAARKWSRWRAQQRYRAVTAGKRKRNGQSERYRKRVRSRNRPEKEAVGEAARVITEEVFSPAAATGLVATSATGASGEVPCNASVPRPAGAPWIASYSGSGAGNRGVT